MSSLKSGVDIVIETPGRLKDLIEMSVCCLTKVSFVVLNGADRMRFELEVHSILIQTCLTRQMERFSATWPLPVHQSTQEFMIWEGRNVVTIGSKIIGATNPSPGIIRGDFAVDIGKIVIHGSDLVESARKWNVGMGKGTHCLQVQIAIEVYFCLKLVVECFTPLAQGIQLKMRPRLLRFYGGVKSLLN